MKSIRNILLLMLIASLTAFLVGCPKPPPKPKPPVVKKEPPPEPEPPPPPPPEPPKPPEPEPPPPPPPEPEPEPVKLPPAPQPPPPEPEPEPVKIDKLDTIYFDFDKSNIRADQESAITKNAGWLKKEENKDVKITIEGHCDERGTDEYNIALGDRRAKSSLKFLVNMGIDVKRIKTISYGESRPVEKGHNEDSWKFNRRAEFIVR